MNSFTVVRFISTSCVRHGKRNFRKFQMPHVRGRLIDKKNPVEVERFGAREPLNSEGTEIIPEKIPELIVPDLKGFELKPYVPFNAPEVIQSEFTAENLFEAIYSEKIENDFRDGKLDEHGNSLDPSPNEELGYEEAKARALSTGADFFCSFSDKEKGK